MKYEVMDLSPEEIKNAVKRIEELREEDKNVRKLYRGRRTNHGEVEPVFRELCKILHITTPMEYHQIMQHATRFVKNPERYIAWKNGMV